MPKRINIQVTEKDIERAHRDNSYDCVVSQAIARTVPDATRIETDSQTIRFTSDGERMIYLTPYAVQGYVIGFDAGDQIEPFSFQLRNPIKARRRNRTPAGKAAVNAATTARRAVADKAVAEQQPADKPVATAKKQLTDKPVATAKEAAKAAYAEARAANPGKATTTTLPGRHVPRVFKKKQRSYGHRLLRINQLEVPDNA